MLDFLLCLQKYVGVFTVFLECWTKVVNHSGDFLKTPTPFGIKHPSEGVHGNYQPLSCVCVAALEKFFPAGVLGAPSSCRRDGAAVLCGISTTPALTGSWQSPALILSPAPAGEMIFFFPVCQKRFKSVPLGLELVTERVNDPAGVTGFVFPLISRSGSILK